MNKTMTVLIALFVLSSPMVVTAEGSAEPEINRMDLDFQGNAALTFMFADDAIPDANNEWRFRKLKPYLFNIKHRNWQHHYQINTSRKEIYRVTGGKFGSMGGRLETIGNVSVDTTGGGGARGLLQRRLDITIEFPSPIRDAIDERTARPLGAGRRFTLPLNTIEAVLLSFAGEPPK